MHPSVILLRKSFAASGANNVWGSLIAAECLYVIPAADSFEVTVGDSMIPVSYTHLTLPTKLEV